MTQPKPTDSHSTDATLSFVARLGLAFAAFFRIVSDGAFATGVDRVRRGALPANVPTQAAKEAPPPESKVRAVDSRAALQLLALFQREGRFVDFLEEDIAGFTDAQVGAAARVVHAGAKKAMHEAFAIGPVRTEEEGARVTLDAGYDADAVRLTGNVTGSAPFTGTLRHRGYRVETVKLPRLHDDHEARVIAPAEVEL